MRLNANQPRILIISALTLALTWGFAGPAHADWKQKVRYMSQGSVCKSDGTNVVIGSKIYQQELGKNGVRQMRIKFLLYNTDPYDGITDWSYLRKTKSSARFPNDAKSYYWDAKMGAQQTWTVSADSGEYWIVAKLTWDRPKRPDWNVKIPAAYCAWSPNG